MDNSQFVCANIYSNLNSFSWEIFYLGICAYFIFGFALNRNHFLEWLFLRTLKKEKHWRVESEYIIDSQAIYYKSEIHKGKIQFSAFCKWKMNADIAILYQTNKCFIPFPRKWFSDAQWEMFLKYIAAALGPSR